MWSDRKQYSISSRPLLVMDFSYFTWNVALLSPDPTVFSKMLIVMTLVYVTVDIHRLWIYDIVYKNEAKSKCTFKVLPGLCQYDLHVSVICDHTLKWNMQFILFELWHLLWRKCWFLLSTCSLKPSVPPISSFPVAEDREKDTNKEKENQGKSLSPTPAIMRNETTWFRSVSSEEESQTTKLNNRCLCVSCPSEL